MIGFVIIALVFLQRLAERHRAGDKQHIGCNDNHCNGNEIQEYRSHRVINGYGNRIRGGKNDCAQNGEHPVCLGRLFADVFAF